MMTLTYIRWKDACSEEASEPASEAKAGLVELREVGFLLHETDEAVLIGMELDGDGVPGGDQAPGRWRLHIPKSNIIERRDWPLSRAFPPSRKVA